MDESRRSWFLRIAPYIMTYATTRQLLGALFTVAIGLGAIGGFYAVSGYSGQAWAFGVPAIAIAVLCAIIMWSGWNRFSD